MAESPELFGPLLRRSRTEAGVSQGRLAQEIGVSTPFICDVEKGHRCLAPAHWPAVIRLLPRLSIEAMARAALSSGVVRIDARDLTDEQRAPLIDALVKVAERAA